MDRLPVEIISEIVSRLEALKEAHYGPWRSNLSPYVTINKAWQSVIEHETFRHIKIDADTLPELIPLLSGATGDRRIRSIRALEFRYIIDWMHPLTPTQPIELSEQQQQLANETFSGDMRAVFGLLKGWEERLGGSEGVAAGRHQLRLFLGRGVDRRVTDPTLLSPPTEDFIIPRGAADAPPDAPVVYHGPHAVVDSWEEFGLLTSGIPRPDLQYIGDDKLPELSLVSSVVVCGGHTIHPKSLMQILSRIKYLDLMDGFIFDETENLDLTREYRKGLCLPLKGYIYLRFSSPDFLLSSSSVSAPAATIAQCTKPGIPVPVSQAADFEFGAC